MLTTPNALVASTDLRKYEYWVVEAACTRHMSYNANDFEYFSACEGTVQDGNKETMGSRSSVN